MNDYNTQTSIASPGRLLRLLPSSAAQMFAVYHKRHDIHSLAAVSGNMNGSSDLVSWFNCIPGPTGPAQVVRRRHFTNPLFDVALVVLHLEMEFRMGIGKRELRDSSLQDNLAILVVNPRRRVVCERQP